MLRTLRIENIAVIEQAEISFDRGFSVLTGETGAGKSIIIDALGAIMGDRVSRELIRTGQHRAVVTALFDALPPRAAAAAAELGVHCEDGQLLLRREITSDGRNLCRINAAPATLPMLRTLGRTLVAIHGQHDGQQLLNDQLHMDYLDEFAHIEQPLSAYLDAYDELLRLNRKLKALSMSVEEQERRRAQLPPLIERLEQADVKPGEEEELTALRARLLAEERIFAALSAAARALEGTDEASGAEAQLSACEAALRPAAGLGAEYEQFAARAKELSVLATELSGDVSGLLTRLDYTPEKLEETEQRLDLIARLSRQAGTSADGLEEYLASLKAELAALESRDDGLDGLKEAYVQKRQHVFELSGVLHERRMAAADELAARIVTELHDLDMPAARFCAQVVDLRTEKQVHFTKKGTDSVCFLLSANRGEELRPLSRIASGGELSRIMLALKNVLGAEDRGMTTVFDEVDAGVSGRAASRVGEKLYRLSTDRQVLCVTHLPQIAGLADQQYYIEKNDRGGRTYTEIRMLDEAGRIGEIARLTAGVHITDATRESAAALLEQCTQYKKRLTTEG